MTPEPTPQEREAILEALGLERRESASPSLWRKSGLGPDEADQAAAPLRQSRGAARA